MPVLEVVGGPGRLSRDSLEELWHFREVLWAFVLRQVKVKYKQAVVGVGWAVIQPVLAALVFALFLFRYGSIPSEGVPALLFTLAGMAGWPRDERSHVDQRGAGQAAAPDALGGRAC